MTISPALRHAYNFHRARPLAFWNRHASGDYAAKALANARLDIAEGRNRYTSSPWAKPLTNPGIGTTQWIETPSAMGLRFVGYADKISDHINHTGWYTDAYQNETIRGVVYQLPGRNGKARFVAGHDNPDNGKADCDGPAFIDWSTIHESDFAAELATARRQIGRSHWTPAMDSPGYWADAAHESARLEAARAADEFTRVEAESMVDYDRAWQAGNQYAEALAEVRETKAELRALLTERRAAKAELRALGYGVGVKGGTLCAAIERQARDLIETLQETATKARNLMEGDGGEYVSFWPGDAKLKAAFNEGAGNEILA